MALLTHSDIMRFWMELIGTFKPALVSTVLLLELMSLVFLCKSDHL